jgi:DNA-binding winged helix-turn-helix (wHTH) protein
MARVRIAPTGPTPRERQLSEPVTTTRACIFEGPAESVPKSALDDRELDSRMDEPLAILTELLRSPRCEEILHQLRDLAQNARPEGGAAPETVEVGDLRIEKHAHRVLVAGSEVALTSLEFRLLVTLVDRRDRVQSRGTLLDELWDLPPSSRTRTVDTHVRRLRDKLGATGQFIHTVRGVGYRFSDMLSIRRPDGRRNVLRRGASERQPPSLVG